MGRGDDTAATRPEHADGEARLVVTGEGLFARHALPEKGRLTIGRASKSDVRVADDSVSRKHAILDVGAQLTIEDLGSANGTWLNNAAVEPGRPRPVAPGDVVRVGKIVLLIERGARPRPSASGPDSPSRGELDAAGLPIVVKSEKLRRLYQLVDLVAPGTINVLLLGETGSGKEVVARSIHARSQRRSGPFVGVNCASLAEALLESELFGHEKGAFTGADRTKPGLLEVAQGGTVFLDEVAELPLATQGKLLRVLEERRVHRLGALDSRPIDVRFVAATNRDVEAAVVAGRFRKDLYFRLNGIVLTVPPLRERRSEIATLATQQAAFFAGKLGRAAPVLSDAALDALQHHEWPGNVRELRNVIERAVLLSQAGPIEPLHLALVASPAALAPSRAAPRSGNQETQRLPALPGPRDLKEELASITRERIVAALEAHAGNQTRAAEALGISRRSFVQKLDQLGLPRPRKGR